jgi:hypothetical protein
MPTVAANARADGALSGEPLPPLAPGQRVTVMIHGFRYAPGAGSACPHRTLYAVNPERSVARVVSWTRKLGLAQSGTGIGFGWQATGTLWNAYRSAGRAGGGLAELVRALRSAGSGPVDVIAHSLGARVALSALPDVQAGDVGRLLLLSAAEFGRPAAQALATPAGRAAEVLNVTSRENDLFDGLFELLLGARMRGLGATLGSGLDARNAVTLQIDSPAHTRALAAIGHRIEPPGRRICHWSAYLRPGLFPLYRAVLDGRLPLPMLRAALPAETAPRWSRLILPLPPAPGAAH